MTDPFIGEVRMLSFDFAPRGWATCDGQVLPINQNQALFSLLGTTWGGNGTTNFNLPDLRGRTPLHFSSAIQLGMRAGEATHTLSVPEMPGHNHALQGTSAAATQPILVNSMLAQTASTDTIYQTASLVAMDASSVGSTGNGTAHENMQPYLAINCCIALQGIFPSRN